MQATFEEPELFQARYQRNNKRGGLKNLRCFPTCAAMHREVSFFGRSEGSTQTSKQSTSP